MKLTTMSLITQTFVSQKNNTICFFLFRLLSGQYIVGVYRYLKEWRKNPHWSLSCCLALFLPLNDLQGEISGLAETDVLKSQVKTGDIEMSTILISLEDGGVPDDKLEKEAGGEDGKQGFDDATEGQEHIVRDRDFSKKCNKETQTEVSTLYCIADIKIKEKTEEKRSSISVSTFMFLSARKVMLHMLVFTSYGVIKSTTHLSNMLDFSALKEVGKFHVK